VQIVQTKRILVTGATGKVGQNFIARFLNDARFENFQRLDEDSSISNSCTYQKQNPLHHSTSPKYYQKSNMAIKSSS
jgi:nucleoside-diphosphate-sugar epimerase